MGSVSDRDFRAAVRRLSLAGGLQLLAAARVPARDVWRGRRVRGRTDRRLVSSRLRSSEITKSCRLREIFPHLRLHLADQIADELRTRSSTRDQQSGWPETVRTVAKVSQKLNERRDRHDIFGAALIAGCSISSPDGRLAVEIPESGLDVPTRRTLKDRISSGKPGAGKRPIILR